MKEGKKNTSMNGLGPPFYSTKRFIAFIDLCFSCQKIA